MAKKTSFFLDTLRVLTGRTSFQLAKKLDKASEKEKQLRESAKVISKGKKKSKAAKDAKEAVKNAQEETQGIRDKLDTRRTLIENPLPREKVVKVLETPIGGPKRLAAASVIGDVTLNNSRGIKFVGSKIKGKAGQAADAFGDAVEQRVKNGLGLDNEGGFLGKFLGNNIMPILGAVASLFFLRGGMQKMALLAIAGFTVHGLMKGKLTDGFTSARLGGNSEPSQKLNSSFISAAALRRSSDTPVPQSTTSAPAAPAPTSDI